MITKISPINKIFRQLRKLSDAMRFRVAGKTGWIEGFVCVGTYLSKVSEATIRPVP